VPGDPAARRERARDPARRPGRWAPGHDDGDGRMRFAIAHKTSTYLMVGFAFVAMIAGGGMSPLITLGGVVGLAASWWWEPPLIRFEKWSWVWTVLSLFALAYSVLTAVLTADFLGVGAQFLVWLTVAKTFNRRAARDWQQLYLLSFLMLVAGSV